MTTEDKATAMVDGFRQLEDGYREEGNHRVAVIVRQARCQLGRESLARLHDILVGPRA